jgi:benzoyl-CoA reductase/2-hydroxyglutaryl-CoA dehydratase subunit BcrC/BadD/HgdB
MKNHKKVVNELLNNVSNEKINYSVKLETEKVETLRKFFSLTKVNASDYFNGIIDFEELKTIIKEYEEVKK